MCINLGLNIKEKMVKQSDHDLLIKIATDVDWLKCKISDHFKKHWWFVTTIITLAISAILAEKFLA